MGAEMEKPQKAQSTPENPEQPGDDSRPVPLAQEPEDQSKQQTALGAEFNNFKKKCRAGSCCKIVLAIISVMTMIISLALLMTAISAAVVIKAYSSDQSGRVVALILLAITAAITISILIYALVATFRAKKKPIHAAAVVLIILAVIQAVICGAGVTFSSKDQTGIVNSLTESFRLMKEGNAKHVKLWDITQYDLSCCGLYSPEDFRLNIMGGNMNMFPPNVPMSCCPTYDPNRSQILQESARTACKGRRLYHQTGCKDLVIQTFSDTAIAVIWMTSVVIVLEIIIALCQSCLLRHFKKKCEDEENARP